VTSSSIQNLFRLDYGGKLEREIARVSAAFDEMTHALEQRDVELKRALQDLQEQAITDPLTGLLNRRYLREYLAQNSEI